MSGVFISYRRDDVGLIAVDVADALKAKIDTTVFFDLQSIEAGKDFQEAIDAALHKCSVVVILLGKDWFGLKEDGKRRVDEPDDIFRQEIEKSIQSNAYIIPVLVGIPSIKEESLNTIRNLANLQWHQIRLGQKKDDVESLVEKAQQALYEQRQAELAGQKDGKVKIEEYSGPLNFVEPPRDSVISRSGGTSFYDDDLNFRVNVAMISGRPLLIIGSEKSGLYSIVSKISNILFWRFYTHTVTEDTTVNDLLYSFDDVQRLSDAQNPQISIDNSRYLEPGILWWAFNPDSAGRRGQSKGNMQASDLFFDPFTGNSSKGKDSVVLIESIENFNPSDVNRLMTVLDRRSFVIKYNQMMVEAVAQILVIFTSDSLRNVAPKVKHNSVVYELPYPSIKWLVENARSNFQEDQQVYIDRVADALTTTMNKFGLTKRIELSDFIMIIDVVIEMNIELNGTNWRILLDSLGLLR